ncbi:MAG: hypothetical protein HY712_07910 [candidate division NC10 bacterium]|nr:hypothetical protein [candidate division NC10 bacterium]
MGTETGWGYMGKLLRVDLTAGSVQEEPLDGHLVETYLGGAGLGAEYLSREVPPHVSWDSPENRIILASGPLGGTILSGTGTFCLVTKGPMTNLAVSTQANGYLGAFLKFAGFDGVIIQGQSPKWVYLYIGDGKADLRDASAMLGKDTWELGDAIRGELGVTQDLSVYGIGPAGENLVRYAVLVGDQGHLCSKGGCGCVMGSKRLKAVAIPRFSQSVPLYDQELFTEKARVLSKAAIENRGGLIHQWGTTALVSSHYHSGALPVRNYTTNVYPEHEKMDGHYLRSHFEHRKKRCWACSLAHNRFTKVTEGPYTGLEAEEPDYESISAWGPLVGNTDPGSMVMLSDLTDRLGLDVNEAGWTVAWVMECYQRGLLSQGDLDGIAMPWGNVEGTRAMLEKTSRREGIGNLLAEGVMRASQAIGGEAARAAVYVQKGATPRGHDHRGFWTEMLETCTSATGTIQAGARLASLPQFGLPPISNNFSPWEVAGACGKLDGWFVFVDCLGICRFITIEPNLTVDCLNAATGRRLTVPEIMKIGRRVITQLRVFNFRHGLDPSLEAPSVRYGSTPSDGPAQGKSIAPYFKWMKSFYFELMGWEPDTGRPLPETLRSLGLEKLIPDMEKQ